MTPSHLPAAEGQRRDIHLLNAEHAQTDHSGGDIDDGIDGADFMQFDGLKGLAMHLCFGLAESANLDPERRFPSMFEPVHGSAPDIAGRGIVNPLAAILSGAMMLDHLECAEAAKSVFDAVAAVLAQGMVRTADLGGSSTTAEVTDAVIVTIR